MPGLALRRTRRKHCSMYAYAPLSVYTSANPHLALNFVRDVTAAHRTTPVLPLIEAYTHECLAMVVDTSFSELRLMHVLDTFISERWPPQAIRCDNRLELTSRDFLARNMDRKINLIHTQPGKPTQNGYEETFTGNVCVLIGSHICSKSDESSPTGNATTTNAGPTAALRARRR